MASSTSDGLPSAWATAVCVLLVAVPAAAAPPATEQARAPSGDAASAKSAARGKLVDGVDLLKRERYAEALQRFQEAYALVPSPVIAYDFGLAYFGMGERVPALEAFETFLRDARDAPADKRLKAEGYCEELRKAVAVVELSADVDTAEVAVDGRNLGPLSFPHRLYLQPGSHEVVARAAAGLARATPFSCRAGQTVAVAIRLSVPPLAPAVAVATAPNGGTGLVPAPEPSIALQPAPPPARSSVWAGARVGGLSAATAGVVALGAGVVFGVMANGDGDALSADARNQRDFTPATEAAGLRHQKLETVFLSIGAVAIAAGVALYAVARHREAGASGREAR